MFESTTSVAVWGSLTGAAAGQCADSRQSAAVLDTALPDQRSQQRCLNPSMAHQHHRKHEAGFQKWNRPRAMYVPDSPGAGPLTEMHHHDHHRGATQGVLVIKSFYREGPDDASVGLESL
jgi:hypothetical protein